MFISLTSNLIVDPHLIKRAITTREKNRFWTPYVNGMAHSITRIPRTYFDSVLISETGATEGDLFDRFIKERRAQFNASSVYLIPVDQVREIVASDFKAFAELFGRAPIRLDTTHLHGDEEIVYCDEESDRFMECWRRVATVFGLRFAR
jgi:hypothetical protein